MSLEVSYCGATLYISLSLSASLSSTLSVVVSPTCRMGVLNSCLFPNLLLTRRGVTAKFEGVAWSCIWLAISGMLCNTVLPFTSPVLYVVEAANGDLCNVDGADWAIRQVGW